MARRSYRVPDRMHDEAVEPVTAGDSVPSSSPGRWRFKHVAREVTPVPIWRTLKLLKQGAARAWAQWRWGTGRPRQGQESGPITERDAIFEPLYATCAQTGYVKDEDRAKLVQSLPLLTDRLLAKVIGRFEKEEIAHAHASDPWVQNYLVNLWEYVKGEDVLSSYPWNVTIPIADVCNARCTFCTSWLEGTRVLAVSDVDQFADVLRFARVLGIAGHGEPLAHPNCDELFDRISRYLDPRCETYVITNAVFLRKRLEALRQLRVTTFNISLNAATPQTHDRVMGLGKDAFSEIVSTIEHLVHQRDTSNPRLEVTISFVINRDNIHELPDFITLGNKLKVTRIYLRTLMPISSLPWGLNYHELPPYRHPQFERYVRRAKRSMARSRAEIVTDVESWSGPVLGSALEEQVKQRTPQLITRIEAARDRTIRERYANYYEDKAGLGRPRADAVDSMEDGTNPYGRAAHYHCSFIYHNFIINDFNMRLIPCCYMAEVPGFEVVQFGTRPFLEYWNSPAFVALRRRLKEGPLYGACKKCPGQPGP